MISIEAIFAIGGLAMIAVGLLGGLEHEKLKIRQLPNWIRATAIISGIVLLAFSIFMAPNSPIKLNNQAVNNSNTINIPIAIGAKKGWQKTDVQINIGDKVDIAVIDGEWTGHRRLLPTSEKVLLSDEYKNYEVYVVFGDETNGEGSTTTCVENEINNCPLPDSQWEKLIARIGLNNPFEIGEHSTFVSDYSGVLELRMNTSDEYLKLSSGVLAVIIKVEKP